MSNGFWGSRISFWKDLRQMIIKNNTKWLCGFFILFIFGVFVMGTDHADAAQDKTSPAISLKADNTEPTNQQNIKLEVKTTDASGIKALKWASGSRTADYFKESGKTLKLNSKNISSVSITKNGTYTFYAIDKAGNEKINKITITNIDTAKPAIAIKKSTQDITKGNVILTFTVGEEGLGVKSLKYLIGKKTVADFANAGKNISLTNTEITKDIYNYQYTGKLTVKSNNTFTFLVEDNAGNKTLKTVTIDNIDKTSSDVGNQKLETVQVKNIDTTKPTLTLNYSVMNQKATITYVAKDSGSGISSIKYLKGKITDASSEKWDTTAKDVTQAGKFTVSSSGNYSVLAQDSAGNKVIQVIYAELEFKAVWISYLEFSNYGKNGFTEKSFKSTIDTMFDNVVDLKMNAVVVQVRPYGDAMYSSSYFPWSKYISGTQGVDPGFDPLEYMVEAAHERGLEFHAWLNPYRVTTSSTDYSKLSKDNPARIWHEDNDKTNDRNVLSYGGNLYYNPAIKEVQTLITNGVKEIVKNYDVDGIHFDDYFYPNLGSKYASTFDSMEYKTYAAECKANSKTALSIADWRRNNVNTLVKNIYSSIKKIDSSVQFGISPGGFINSLSSDTAYYVDYETWLSSDKYIDYICPQIYWTFSNSTYPFDETLKKWLSYRTSSTVKMYVGIATYRAGSTLESDWKNDSNVLKKQVEYGRDTGLVDGFIFFRYDFFYNKVTKQGVDKLLKIM